MADDGGVGDGMIDIEAANAAGEARRRTGPLATGARYDGRTHRVVIVLRSGVEIAVPPAVVEGLSDAPRDALRSVEVTPSGLGLHFPDLDVDLDIPALLAGVTGSRTWMAGELGRRGGMARTAAKAAASRANGRKGGRPKRQAVPA